MQSKYVFTITNKLYWLIFRRNVIKYQIVREMGVDYLCSMLVIAVMHNIMLQLRNFRDLCSNYGELGAAISLLVNVRGCALHEIQMHT